MKKLVSILLALTLAVSLNLVMAVPVAAGTIHVASGESIQGAIDDASPGDTINVVVGTYDEVVTVDVEGLTIKGESLAAIVKGGFILKADNIAIDGLTIKNGTNERGILTQAATGPTWGSKGHQVINNDIIGPGDDTGYGIAESVNIKTWRNAKAYNQVSHAGDEKVIRKS